jgi:hypothetical protein
MCINKKKFLKMDEKKFLIDLHIDNGYSFRNMIHMLSSFKRKHIGFVFTKDSISITSPMDVDGLLIINHITLDTNTISIKKYEYNIRNENGSLKKEKTFAIDIDEFNRGLSTIKKNDKIRIFFRTEIDFFIQKISKADNESEDQRPVVKCKIETDVNIENDTDQYVHECEILFKDNKGNCKISPEHFGEQIKSAKSNGISCIEIRGLLGKNSAIFTSFLADKESLKGLKKFGDDDFSKKYIKQNGKVIPVPPDGEVNFKIDVSFFKALNKLTSIVNKNALINISFTQEVMRISTQTESINIKFYIKKNLL